MQRLWQALRVYLSSIVPHLDRRRGRFVVDEIRSRRALEKSPRLNRRSTPALASGCSKKIGEPIGRVEQGVGKSTVNLLGGLPTKGSSSPSVWDPSDS